jgi:hypothetical protein
MYRPSVIALLFLFYSIGATAESLSFRLDQTTGEVIVVVSGYVPLCAPRIEPPLAIGFNGTTIAVTSNALDSTGGCMPPPGYLGPYYEVTASLGHLSAPLYTVTWLWSGYNSPIATVLFAPASLQPQAVPALSSNSLICLGLLLAISCWLGYVTLAGDDR